MKILRSFIALSFIFFTVPAYAYDLTLFGGVQRQGELTLQSGVQQVSNTTFDPRNFGVFGARFGHGSVFGGEHTLAYAPNFIDSRSKAFIYNSNLLIQAPIPAVKPYATAGLGGIFTSGDSITDIGSKFAINYGGGLKIMPAGPVGARIDVRGYTVPSVQDQTLNIIEVSVGVVFSF